MMLSFLYEIAVLCTVLWLVECEVDKTIGTCNYPEVHSAFFDDEHVGSKQPPVLHSINSTVYIDVDKVFSYQYIFMSCRAPYPIEWIGNVPQHYYFSYILDDEVRTYDSSTNNATSQEIYSVRLHIGNETLSKQVFKNVSVVCQPVASDACGKTLVFIQKYRDDENKTMIGIRFSHIANDGVEENEEQTHEWNNCDSRNTSLAPKLERPVLQCSSTEALDFAEETEFAKGVYKFQESANCANDTDLTAVQFDINPATLKRPSGVLTCTANSRLKDSVVNVPYFFSLPRLCPNEDIMLPHLYYGNDGISNQDESHFISICVQNASVSDIYVGDTVTVTCISSIYYFAQGMRVELLLHSSSNETSQYQDLKEFAKEQSFGPGGYRNTTTSFVVESDDLQEVVCSAPVRRSIKWVVKSVIFKPKVPIKVSIQRTVDSEKKDASGAPYIICNASGDPLPTLLWSRLNNEKMPSNQTVLASNDSLASNKSSWISSTLHFPINPPIEYYGRYVCTAKNRFSTVEKLLIFDDISNDEGVSILGSNGVGVWFWMMVSLSMIILIVAVAWLGVKLRHQARNLRLFTKSEIDDFLFGKPELLLDDSDAYEEMNTYAAYLPYDKSQFEIQREQLEFDPKDILGTGAFGTVYKGVFKGEYGAVEPVAIKTVNPSSDKMYFAALLSEIKIMCYIGKHGNVVGLIGACTKYLDQRLIFVATEYCPNGDLLSYILKNRTTFMNNAGLQSEPINKPGNGYCRLSYGKLILSPHLLLVWAHQIAQGMTFLSSKKVIHGDLAARNILLAGDLKPKIADFGLSKQLQKYANYVRKGDDLVPWRWLAVESLQFMKFSIQSDIWAFGVVLYELFSLGQVPYGSHTYSELFIVSLCQGERLQRPAFASEKLYEIMLDCWKHAPEHRPSFANLENALKYLSTESETKMLMSLSSPAGPSSGQIATNGVLKTVFHTDESRPHYVNNGGPENQGKSSYMKWGSGITENTKTGYVTEMGSTHPVQIVQNGHRYVQNSVLPPPPPPNSYIDWNAVSA